MANKPTLTIQQIYDIVKRHYRCLHNFGAQGICTACLAQYPSNRVEVQDLTPYALSVMAQALLPIFDTYAEYTAQRTAELLLDGVVSKIMDGRLPPGSSDTDDDGSSPVTRGGQLRP